MDDGGVQCVCLDMDGGQLSRYTHTCLACTFLLSPYLGWWWKKGRLDASKMTSCLLSYSGEHQAIYNNQDNFYMAIIKMCIKLF